MRLDAHTHIFDYSRIEEMREVVAREGITHYVGMTRDVELLGRLDEAGARGLPFLWANIRERLPLEGPPVAGYKIHPRHTEPRGTSFYVANEETLGPICRDAGRMGRPLLFHTDCDWPRACSLPMLAELAILHPETAFIAAHLGVYSQEYFLKNYTPEEWMPVARQAMRQNVQLLLCTGNLYADTTKFGLDFSLRAPDTDFKFTIFADAVGALTPAARKALVDKLFIGTDFPCDWNLDPSLPGHSYNHQVACMRQIFGDDLDEDRMTRHFLALLPDEFAGA